MTGDSVNNREPRSVQRMLELFRDLNSTPKDLICVIDKDPMVTVKILEVINSAYYSFPKQFASIGHAVVYQGFNFIKNLTLSIAVIGMLPKDNDSRFDVQQHLLRSLTAAAIAKKLAGLSM
jgi:HD-like signal output (HDOD) protein